MANEESGVQPEVAEPVEPATPIIESEQPEIDETVLQDVKEVRTNFTTCGICGLFLASALIDIGERKFEIAIANIQDDWFSLPWNKSMMDLVNKCFGFVIDIDDYHFEGCCPECTRPYQYTHPDPDNPPEFHIKGIV